ncbi:hypothetical protein THOM_2104 [Trachipleistophora hominis]|uniref:Uncharacterized protein n=1 Tax=Trachipleistophora hominis TaxID=72359 RepID=L7JUH7_TRAHO|nr:hypothetical protein THOM_2104 [Trachipleistophora hominis]
MSAPNSISNSFDQKDDLTLRSIKNIVKRYNKQRKVTQTDTSPTYLKLLLTSCKDELKEMSKNKKRITSMEIEKMMSLIGEISQEINDLGKICGVEKKRNTRMVYYSLFVICIIVGVVVGAIVKLQILK